MFGKSLYHLQAFARFSNYLVVLQHSDKMVQWKIHILCTSSNYQQCAYDLTYSSPSLYCIWVNRCSCHGNECTIPVNRKPVERELCVCNTNKKMVSSMKYDKYLPQCILPMRWCVSANSISLMLNLSQSLRSIRHSENWTTNGKWNENRVKNKID